MFKKSLIKNDFMHNLSSLKKDNKSIALSEVSETNTKPLIEEVSQETRMQILEQSKNISIKTVASNKFIKAINQFQSNPFNEIQKVHSENSVDNSKEDKYQEAFNAGLYYINQFTKKPSDRENLKLSLDYFSEATKINNKKGEAFYFLAYIAYLVNDIPLAERFYKISSYLNPEQKYLISLGRKISNHKFRSIKK